MSLKSDNVERIVMWMDADHGAWDKVQVFMKVTVISLYCSD